MPYTDTDHIKYLEAQVAELQRRIAATSHAASRGADHGTIMRMLDARPSDLAVLDRLDALRSAPTMGYSVKSVTGQRSLFLERPRAEMACVQYHGTMVELIERPVV